MNTRGVLYIYWGDLEDELQRSIESIKKYELPYHVVKIDSKKAGLYAKSVMYSYSPFQETLFLDTDTIVLSDVSFGFEMALRHGIAVTIAPGCFASRFTHDVVSDLVEYNTSVIFWSQSKEVESLFKRWTELAPYYHINDQTSFSKAVYEEKFNPYVLQTNWNFRAHLTPQLIFGPLKIWHSRTPVPKNINAWNNKKNLGFGIFDQDREMINPELFRRNIPFSIRFFKFLKRIVRIVRKA